MSWSDTILSNTVGVAFRAYTGNVDPWTLANIKEDTHADIATAMGAKDPATYGPVDPAALAVAQAKADSAIDANLISQNAHPDQATALPRIPGLGVIGSPEFLKKAEHLVYAILAIAAVGTAGYFALKYKNTLKSLVK